MGGRGNTGCPRCEGHHQAGRLSVGSSAQADQRRQCRNWNGVVMGAGARMAAERDRWPDHWRVADLEFEEEGVLDLLQHDEELVAVVPGMRSTPEEGQSQVLIAVTDR